MSEQLSPQTYDLSSFSEADLQRLAENTQRQLETIRKSKRSIPQKDPSLEQIILSVQKASAEHDVFPRSIVAAICNAFNVGVTLNETVSVEEFNAAKAIESPVKPEKTAEAPDTVVVSEKSETAEAISPTQPRELPDKQKRTTTKRRTKKAKPAAAATPAARTTGKVKLSAPVSRKRQPVKPAPEKGSPVITSKSSRLVPKYTHPENPEMTWSGTGKKPRWVIACQEAGMSMQELLTR